MPRLFIALEDMPNPSPVYKVIPFLPKKDDICTLKEICPGGYTFEEVTVIDLSNGDEACFTVEKWREITDIPSSEEVAKMIEELETVSI